MIGPLVRVVQADAAPSLMGLLLYAVPQLVNNIVFGRNLGGYESCFGDSLTGSAMPPLACEISVLSKGLDSIDRTPMTRLEIRPSGSNRARKPQETNRSLSAWNMNAGGEQDREFSATSVTGVPLRAE